MSNLVKHGSFNPAELTRYADTMNASMGSSFWTPPGAKGKWVKSRICIPPPLAPLTPPNSPLLLVPEHRYEKPDGKAVTFACPRVLDKKACPLCQHAQRLEASRNPVDNEDAWKYFPRSRGYANVVDRSEPDKGTQVWGFSAGKKKSIWVEFQRIFQDTDGEDIFDPETGRDIIVDRTGTGAKDTEYRVNISKPDDQRVVLPEWIENQQNLMRFARLYTAERILELLGDEFDSGGAPEPAQRSAGSRHTRPGEEITGEAAADGEEVPS